MLGLYGGFHAEMTVLLREKDIPHIGIYGVYLIFNEQKRVVKVYEYVVIFNTRPVRWDGDMV